MDRWNWPLQSRRVNEFRKGENQRGIFIKYISGDDIVLSMQDLIVVGERKCTVLLLLPTKGEVPS